MRLIDNKCHSNSRSVLAKKTSGLGSNEVSVGQRITRCDAKGDSPDNAHVWSRAELKSKTGEFLCNFGGAQRGDASPGFAPLYGKTACLFKAPGKLQHSSLAKVRPEYLHS